MERKAIVMHCFKDDGTIDETKPPVCLPETRVRLKITHVCTKDKWTTKLEMEYYFVD